jgi:potassium efflux system protein
VLEKDGVAVNHFNMPAQLTSHWRRQIVRISLALLPLHFWSVVSELSPLHLMDDVLGQTVILLNLLLITGWSGRCSAKAGEIKSLMAFVLSP